MNEEFFGNPDRREDQEANASNDQSTPAQSGEFSQSDSKAPNQSVNVGQTDHASRVADPERFSRLGEAAEEPSYNGDSSQKQIYSQEFGSVDTDKNSGGSTSWNAAGGQISNQEDPSSLGAQDGSSQSVYGQSGYHGTGPDAGVPQAVYGAAHGQQANGQTDHLDNGSFQFHTGQVGFEQPETRAMETSSYGAQEQGSQPLEQNPYAQGGQPPVAQQPGSVRYSQWPEYRQGVDDSSAGGRPPKKKMDKGLKIFLWAVGIVLGGFVLAFSGYGIYSAISGLPTGENPSSSSPSPSTSSGASSFPQINNNVPSGPVTDPNWGGLELENQQKLDGGSDTLSAAEIYEKQAPAIVGICVYNQGSQPGDDPAMEGSGIIISENGYIMTNSHVVNDSNEFPVEVVLSTGDRYAATVVGYDKRTDLAVVKVEAAGLPVATLGNSDELRVGDWVLAIGNPGGLNYSNSLTRGIVSAINRSVESKAQTAMKYIQTDTAINPGNSGGALLNMYGQVIGINTAKIQGYEGMGFAIPITTAKKIVDDIIQNGYVAGRVRLGLTGSIVSEYHARMYNLPQGVIIRSLTNDSDLVAKGVKEDDIITKINDKDVTSMDDIYDELANHKPGDTVKLTIFRSGTGMTKSTTFEVEVTLLEDKGETQQ